MSFITSLQGFTREDMLDALSIDRTSLMPLVCHPYAYPPSPGLNNSTSKKHQVHRAPMTKKSRTNLTITSLRHPEDAIPCYRLKRNLEPSDARDQVLDGEILVYPDGPIHVFPTIGSCFEILEDLGPQDWSHRPTVNGRLVPSKISRVFY